MLNKTNSDIQNFTWDVIGNAVSNASDNSTKHDVHVINNERNNTSRGTWHVIFSILKRELEHVK